MNARRLMSDMGLPSAGAHTGHDTANPPRSRPSGGRRCVIWGSGMERAPYLRSSFGHTLPNTMQPSFLNDGSIGGDIMIERAEEARPRSEIVWVALYSILVFLLMAA